MYDMSVDSGIFLLSAISYQMLRMMLTCVVCRTVCVHSRVSWLRAVMCVFERVPDSALTLEDAYQLVYTHICWQRQCETFKMCLHRFCHDCIQKYLRLGQKECPTCRVKVLERKCMYQCLYSSQ
jgi:hypothetical protein